MFGSVFYVGDMFETVFNTSDELGNIINTRVVFESELQHDINKQLVCNLVM